MIRVFVRVRLIGLGLVLGFELVLWLFLLLVFRLGLGLGSVMTVQFKLMTLQIKTGNHGSAAPRFLAHAYCRQTAGWIKMPFGMAVRVGPDHIVLDGNSAPP